MQGAGEAQAGSLALGTSTLSGKKRMCCGLYTVKDTEKKHHLRAITHRHCLGPDANGHTAEK
jgi:hypothetical protein